MESISKNPNPNEQEKDNSLYIDETERFEKFEHENKNFLQELNNAKQEANLDVKKKCQ